MLRDALGLALPDFDYVEQTDADLSQVVPPEYRADQDRETKMLYSDMILQAVHHAARKKMEEWMQIDDYEFRSDIALRGRAKGREEGRVEGVAKSLLKVLSARGLQVTEDQQAQILGCTDLDTLNTWLDRVLQVADVDELLR